MYDLVIKNGTIIDGTGAAPYQADLAIKEGKIAHIAQSLKCTGSTTVIDAAGLTVTPGFIDSHSHSDRSILPYPDQKEKLEQGITVSVTGHCGGSQAPKRMGDTIYKMSDFLREASKVPQGSAAVNLVGHGSIRSAVMANENRRPTPEEMEQMKELLRDALESGAIGMSLGLIYVPSCYSETEELTEMARVVASYDGLVTAHIRNEGDFLLESVEEFIAIIKASKAHGVISHLKAAEKHNWGKVNTALQMIDEARAEGYDIYCDVYPYCASSTSLIARVLPSQFHPAGTKSAVALLDDPEVLVPIKAWARERWKGDLSWIQITSCAGHPEYAGKRLHEIAAIRGSEDQLETAYELIRESNNQVNASFFTMCEEDVERVLSYERSMICTDSAAACGSTSYHPRLRASFVRALSRYVRERGTLTLPEMIRKMTSLPAQVYGLREKGILAPGYDADLCIFDAARIRDCADFTHCTDKNEGLSYVLVGGEIVVTDGVHNGKRNAGIYLRS